MVNRDVIVIGAGASGLMCAWEAARRGRSVLVLDHAGRIGKKILVSGGGCCNFTNRVVTAGHYISGNRHFCKSALSRFSSEDFCAFMKRHRISYGEREDGQLFCTGSAAQIVAALQEECDRAGVAIALNHTVTAIEKTDRFVVRSQGREYAGGALVVATGGVSWPHLGATDLGFRIARQFGLRVVPPRPGLVPLVFSEDMRQRYSCLSGVSLVAVVRCRRQEFRGSVLFTHRGLSGPAILQISLVWLPGDEILIDLFPDADTHALLREHRHTKTALPNLLARFLPKRFAAVWCAEQALSRPLNSYSDKELAGIAGLLHAWTVVPAGTEGFKKAEVTIGGVDTDELSSKTLEAKTVPGLYFVGEVVDVTGHLGGYNLQWAWSSGWAAGQVV